MFSVSVIFSEVKCSDQILIHTSRRPEAILRSMSQILKPKSNITLQTIKIMTAVRKRSIFELLLQPSKTSVISFTSGRKKYDDFLPIFLHFHQAPPEPLEVLEAHFVSGLAQRQLC